jgi:hypothetical protein
MVTRAMLLVALVAFQFTGMVLGESAFTNPSTEARPAALKLSNLELNENNSDLRGCVAIHR